MRKSALLIAAGFAMLAPSFARADAGPTPCCQDTVKMFQRGADAWKTPNMPVPYKAADWKPYTPPPAGTPICCQDTVKMFQRGADAWGWWQPPAADKKKK